LPYVLTVSKTLSLTYDVEFEELVGTGNLTLVEKLDVALGKQNAYSYLKGIVKRTLYYYCLRHSKVWEFDDTIFSPEPMEEQVRDYTFLYEAVDRLPENQRQVVMMHYGLKDTPKESLYELSLKASKSSKGSMLYLRLKRATDKLRGLLAQTPMYA
jgi:DNA-directed RNA polymerase specialized sigma24 family protein